MEEKSISDEKNKNSLITPIISGKKLKLNDGSSQDSLQEAGVLTTGSSNSEEKSKNEDSSVTADKSPNTSNDENVASTSEGPSNELVNVAPSSSNVRAILLNIIHPKRNYRKRKTPEDSDSNSSTDSDDWGRGLQDIRQPDNSNSEPESLDMQPLIYTEELSVASSPISNTSSDSNATDDSEEMENMIYDDSDDLPQVMEDKQDDAEMHKIPLVLTKTQPKHNFVILREIMNREMGLTFLCSQTSKANVNFEKRFSGSLHAVYRMKKLHMLTKHKQCVNSINFHPEGNLLVSGSDDLSIIVWDWARNKPLQIVKTGHRSNVLQSKFLHLNARSQLNIVTCGRDGQVRLIQCPPSGGLGVSRRRLAAHSRAVHKLQVSPGEPHLVLSCGEDGVVMQCDVRAEHASRLFQVREKGSHIPLYSIDGHPFDPKELLIAGKDKCVRIYDRRKSTKPVALYCPDFFYNVDKSTRKKEIQLAIIHVTCAVYNYNGTEILSSYNDDDVYLFDVKNDVYDAETRNEMTMGYKHRYSGHRNSATYKGVSFFGPRSEYIVSGSDCSHIFFWEKKTEAIVQWMQGDLNGVVNCIEEHPRFPVLATSGLDRDVKIWIPRALKDPDYYGMEKIVRENATELPSPLFNDFLPSLYTAWHSDMMRDNPPRRRSEDSEFDGNMCTAF